MTSPSGRDWALLMSWGKSASKHVRPGNGKQKAEVVGCWRPAEWVPTTSNGNEHFGEQVQKPGMLMSLGWEDLSWRSGLWDLETDAALLQQCGQIICFASLINMSPCTSRGRDLKIKRKGIFYGGTRSFNLSPGFSLNENDLLFVFKDG